MLSSYSLLFSIVADPNLFLTDQNLGKNLNADPDPAVLTKEPLLVILK